MHLVRRYLSGEQSLTLKWVEATGWYLDGNQQDGYTLTTTTLNRFRPRRFLQYIGAAEERTCSDDGCSVLQDPVYTPYETNVAAQRQRFSFWCGPDDAVFIQAWGSNSWFGPANRRVEDYNFF